MGKNELIECETKLFKMITKRQSIILASVNEQAKKLKELEKRMEKLESTP